MLRWIRKRLSNEDGVTIVETMFAVLVLSVAMFGLLGTLLASAASQIDQRSRTGATRFANEHLEDLRQLGFTQMKIDKLAGCPAGSSCAVRTSPDGQFTATPTITEVDAETLGAVRVGYPRVMRITDTITWSVQGRARSAVYNTAIAPRDASLAQVIQSITMTPEVLVVNQLGVPSTPLNITARLTGFAAGVPLKLNYTDDVGAKSVNLTSADGENWSGSISQAALKKVLDPSTGTGTMDFLAEIAGTEGTITQSATLFLSNTTIPVRLSNAKVAPYPIATGDVVVMRSGGSRDLNRDYILFEATGHGLNFDAAGNVNEIVRVNIPITGAGPMPTNCVTAPGGWSCQLTYSTKYGTFRWPGAYSGYMPALVAKITRSAGSTPRSFVFTITRPADGTSASVTVQKMVVNS